MKITKTIQADNPNPKYVQLVESAYGLFWKYGIKRVSVEEICRTAGVSKMTFYNHFKNKVELAVYVLEKVMQTGMEIYRNIMDREGPFAEKAADFVQMKMDASDGISQAILEDFLHSPIPEVAEYLNVKTRENLEMLLNDFSKAQKKGEIRPDIEPRFLLYFINQMRAMASDNNLIALYDSPLAMSRELLNLLFYGILTR